MVVGRVGGDGGGDAHGGVGPFQFTLPRHGPAKLKDIPARIYV